MLTIFLERLDTCWDVAICSVSSWNSSLGIFTRLDMFWAGLESLVAFPTPNPNLFYYTPTPGVLEVYFSLDD